MGVLTYSQQAPLQGYYQWLQAQGLASCVARRERRGEGAPTPLMAGAGVVTGSDFVRITAWQDWGDPLRVVIRGRLLRADGQVSDFGETIIPPSDKSPLSVDILLADGVLQWVTVSTSDSNVCRGYCYVTVALRRADDSNSSPFATLLGGWVSSITPLTWPGSPYEHYQEGHGRMTVYSATIPGPHEEPALFTSLRTANKISEVTFDFTTDGTAGDRLLVAHIYDPFLGPLTEAPAPVVQAPSTTRTYIFNAGNGGEGSAGTYIWGNLSCCYSPIVGAYINVCVHGTWGANDQFGAMLVGVEEYFHLCANE